MCGTVAWLWKHRDDEQFDLAAWFPSLKYCWSRVASFYIFLYLGNVNSAGSFTLVTGTKCVRYQVPDIFTPLCRLWDITPTSGVAGTAEIVLDAVLEDVSSSFTLWLGVLALNSLQRIVNNLLRWYSLIFLPYLMCPYLG
jgi:hypothetical protein